MHRRDFLERSSRSDRHFDVFLLVPASRRWRALKPEAHFGSRRHILSWALRLWRPPWRKAIPSRCSIAASPIPICFPTSKDSEDSAAAIAGDQDFSSLAKRHFDVAVDVWPNDPVTVTSAAEFLKDRVGHYLYVSSVAAYDGKEF